MLIEYSKFYRKFGMRRVGDFLNPRVVAFDKLKLPKSSSIHFPQFGDSNFWVRQDHFLAHDIKRYMYCEVIEEYDQESILGSYRIAPGNVNMMKRDYYQQNKRIRRYKADSPVNEPMTLVFHTYGLLNRRYKYFAKRRDTEMNHWLNHWNTVISNLNVEALNSNRHQFVIIDVPQTFPRLQRLLTNEDLKLATVKHYKNPDHWMVRSLWNYFTEPGKVENGVPFIFKHLEEKALSNINIIWKLGNRCTITRLDLLRNLNSSFSSDGRFASVRFNKYLLNMFLTMADAPEIIDTENYTELDDTDDTDTTMVDDSVFDTELTDDTDLDSQITIGEDDDTDYSEQELDDVFDGFGSDADIDEDEWLESEKLRQVSDSDDFEDIDTQIPEEESFDAIVEGKLAAMDKVQADDTEDGDGFNDDAPDDIDMTSEELTYKPYEAEDIETDNFDTLIVEEATKRAREGLLTAGELRLATKNASKYRSLKDPRDNTKMFSDLLNVTEEDIKIDGDVSVANEAVSELIPDKTMTKSSLKQFDKKYINEVMNKHISKTVMEVAKAGISIQDYDVERVTNLTDDFEIHSVRLTTVNGKQSTLRFRMPVVDENGTFKAGGNKLRMRKQWADKNYVRQGQ